MVHMAAWRRAWPRSADLCGVGSAAVARGGGAAGGEDGQLNQYQQHNCCAPQC